MVTIYFYTLVSVAIISLISFIGVFSLSLKEEVLKKYVLIFISLAIGALLGDAFIHLIPEAFKVSTDTTLTGFLIITGILIFFILEKFLHWHHHGEDKEEKHIHPVGKLVLFSDAFHNFIDGIIIGSGFLINIPTGIATALAVILHEIPQEIGDFAVLIYSGYTKTRALWLNFFSALTSILGIIVLFTINGVYEVSSTLFLPIAAGGFIYIAVADLIPVLNKTKETKKSIVQIAGISIGILAMVLLIYLD